MMHGTKLSSGESLINIIQLFSKVSCFRNDNYLQSAEIPIDVSIVEQLLQSPLQYKYFPATNGRRHT